jgi:hypothetical protein
MKRPTKPKSDVAKLAPLRKLIQDATGAPLDDLGMIEHVMRDDVFHSTLDWQTAEQLKAAAREAYQLLKENRDLYELERKQALTFFAQAK